MYLHHRICIETMKRESHIAHNSKTSSFQLIQDNIEKILINNPTLKRINAQTKEKKSGYWWLKSGLKFNNRLTYSEVLENETFEYYQHQEIINEQAFFKYAASFFPGSYSPPRGLMLDCLEAYGYATKDRYWHISEMDQPPKRQAVIRDIITQLCHLGKSYGFDIEKNLEAVIWKQQGKRYHFHILKTGICSPYLPAPGDVDNEIIALIFPGSKSKLIHYRWNMTHDTNKLQNAAISSNSVIYYVCLVNKHKQTWSHFYNPLQRINQVCRICVR